MSLKTNLPAGWSRRSILKGGAALGAAGFAGLPFIGNAFGQDNLLHFWQFYAPGGDVKTQVDWFMKMADDWNAQSEVKVPSELSWNGSLKLQGIWVPRTEKRCTGDIIQSTLAVFFSVLEERAPLPIKLIPVCETPGVGRG